LSLLSENDVLSPAEPLTRNRVPLLASSHTPAKVSIGPMRVSVLTAEELIHRLIGHTFGETTHHVVTANAQFYVLAEQDQIFQRCVHEAEYVCADGVSISMACRWLGKTRVARIAGVDLIPQLCRQAAQLGLPAYFLGGTPGAGKRTAELLSDVFPGLRVAGVNCPPAGFLDQPEVLAAVLASISSAVPAILFVALGAPQQEYFIQRYIRPMGVPVAMGVGGSFEMIAGVRQRAPQWMRRAGMEWIFRWAQEPKRLARRYLVGNSLFSIYILRYLMRRSRR
jgi:N-acetylglucosaminyldiphosphoundecaprenol N-acetyl-beta-D-mannosaminyltransferase